MVSKTPEARREEIINGPLIKVLFRLSLPTMGAAFLDTIYSFLDSIWLGGIGSSSISAPMLTLTVLWLMFSIFGGIINGAFPYIAQNRGAGKDEDARKAAGQAMLLSMIILGPLIATFLLLLPYIATFFGLKGAFREDFLAYARIVIFSDIALGLAQMCLGLIRLWGYPEVALYVRVPFVFLNAVLDPFLIYGWGPFPRLEVRGAAIATLIAEVLEASTLIALIFLHPRIRLRPKHFKVDISLIRRIIYIGSPLGFSRMITTSGFFVLLIVISRVGEYMITAWSLVNRVMDIFTWMTFAFNMASATMIGQAIGNNDFIRAKEIARKTALIVVGIRFLGSLAVAIFARPILEIFHRNPEDPLRDLVISTSVTGMWTFGMSAAFFALSIVSLAPFRASGKTQYDMLISMVRLWGLRVPLSYVLGILLGYGSLGVWVGMALSNLIAGLLAYALMEKDLWIHRIIE